jgi:hypothetical protein
MIRLTADVDRGPAKPAMSAFRGLRPAMISGARAIHFDRARNSDGEFAPQTEGGPDPATMRAAYGPVNRRPGALRSALGIVADTAGAAGGAVTIGSMVAKKLRRNL